MIALGTEAVARELRGPRRKKYVLRLEMRFEAHDDVEAREVGLRFRESFSTMLASLAYKAISMMRAGNVNIDWKLQELQNGKPPRGLAQGQLREESERV